MDVTRNGMQAGRFAAIPVQPRTVSRKERQRKDADQKAQTCRGALERTERGQGGVGRLLVSAGRGGGAGALVPWARMGRL